jgi:biopolymer transport protein ExbD
MPLKTQLDDAPAINMTPMIDMVFLLIIFFLVATTFSRPEQTMQIDVPQVETAGALSDRPSARVVNVYRDGRIELDGEEVTLGELTQRLSAIHGEYPDLQVDIRGDGHAFHQNVAEAAGACMNAGVASVGITVREKED